MRTFSERFRFVTDFIRILTEKRVTRSAAELSYFLTLSLFPLLILLVWFFGKLNLDLAEVLDTIRIVLPAGTVHTLEEYLDYVMRFSSNTMMIAAFMILISSASAAFRSILKLADDIYDRDKFSGIKQFALSFLFPPGFLITIYFSIVVLVTGGYFTSLLEEYLPFSGLGDIWIWLRFPILFVMLCLLLYLLYHYIAPKSSKHRPILLCSLLTALILVTVSIFFSWFISFSTRYSLVYGSLASIVILMVWLYVCSNVILIGGVFNYYLLSKRKLSR